VHRPAVLLHDRLLTGTRLPACCATRHSPLLYDFVNIDGMINV
jgi:hypothetical protein